MKVGRKIFYLTQCVLFIIFLFQQQAVFAVPLENLVSRALAGFVSSSDQPIIETQLSNPSLRLIPHNNELHQSVNRIISSLSPNVMVETLFLYKKPTSFHSSAENWNESQKLGVFNQLVAISSLAGIQYFSASRNTMRTFYETSVIIEGATSRNPLRDPVFTALPSTLTLHARQKDGTFGENVYRYDFTTTPQAIFFTQENVTALSYGIVPLISRGNLRSVMAFIDCGDSILIYAVSMARASVLPGMSDRVGNSFRNRAQAILNWFTGRLDRNLFI